VKDLTRDEFDKWLAASWFDGRNIDGTTYYFSASVANLYFRHPDLVARRINAKDPAEQERWRYDVITEIKKAAQAEKTPYVVPKTFEVDMNVTAKPTAAPAGDTIRAWIPIPRKYPFQDEFKLLSSSEKPISIGSPDSPIRSIYFEQKAREGQPTKFAFEYEYTIRGVHFDLDPKKIQPCDTNDPSLKRFVSEAPHVVFTPEIKALSASIVGDETNPMLKAKKIFDWQSDHLLYSYALEYSTIRDISDYCRSHGYGDCGQQALLFITLCRYNGVPARWQSGWDLTPHSTTIHDWSEIYLAPYGWMPVDPYMGNYAMRYVKTLSDEQKKEMRDFYFGGLDQYRMIANSDHDQTLNPPKLSMRSDDVDFQRGELEHGDKNIYFDQYSYSFKYKVLPPQQSLP
jgi:transglutaminase-like putative cysteine protease